MHHFISPQTCSCCYGIRACSRLQDTRQCSRLSVAAALEYSVKFILTTYNVVIAIFNGRNKQDNDEGDESGVVRHRADLRYALRGKACY